MGLHDKGDQVSLQLTHGSASSGQSSCSGVQWKCFVCALFHHIVYWTVWIQGSWFNKIDYFNCLLTGVPKSGWPLFCPALFCNTSAWQQAPVGSSASALVGRKAQQFYSALVLYHECKFQHCEKADHTSVWLGKLFWFLRALKRLFRAHTGPQTSLWKPLAYCLHRIVPKGEKHRNFYDIIACFQKVYN